MNLVVGEKWYVIGSPWGTRLKEEPQKWGLSLKSHLLSTRLFTSVSGTPVLGSLVIMAVIMGRAVMLCLPRRLGSMAFCPWGMIYLVDSHSPRRGQSYFLLLAGNSIWFNNYLLIY